MRFPGFTEEWESLLASDFLECFSTNSLTWDELNFNEGKIKDLHYGLIHTAFDTSIVSSKSAAIPWINKGREPKRYTSIKNGDLLLADASEDTDEVGEPLELSDCDDTETVIAGLHTIHCRDKLNKTVPGFKAYLFQSKSVRSQIEHLCQGSKIYSISPSNLREITVSIPQSKEEQGKIVSLLLSLEKRIEVQRKTIEDLNALIQELTNRLFSFDCPNKCLSQMIEECSYRAGDRYNLTDVYSVTNTQGFVKQEEQFGKGIIAGNDRTNYKVVRDGTWAYNPARINVGSICRFKNKLGLVSPMYVCFRLKTENLEDAIYLDYFLKSDQFRRQLKEKSEGGVRVLLTYENLSKIKIPVIPTDLRNSSLETFKTFTKLLSFALKEILLLKEIKRYCLNVLFC